MTNVSKDRYTGSSFEGFLVEEGLLEETTSTAIKRVLAWQLEQEMIRQRKTKQSMAAELKTSRSQLDRLLDPNNTAVSLETLSRAARALGKRLVLELRDPATQSTSAPKTARQRARSRPGPQQPEAA
ncbi:Helix-turn-helix domain-containing protein [Bryocella elongata]|uniref:Helix-turn-helix domain-containing protein n=1 Tax=Bryocella elongata TaxID=863522 RepID=A0A1H5ZQB9_9BACT|nr:helix-turn-helix transcriptional regulator [Bryocella elongata]SEG37596.1 Helix-turn-helix domain-containing protein [Bryocella elongata]